MREIKFRAWDVETKQMRFGEDIFVQFDGKRIVRDNYKTWESQCAVIGFEDCIDDITHGVYLMQFTGLYDTDGQEIYEGDVVQQNVESRKMEVVFEDGAFLVRHVGKSGQPVYQRLAFYATHLSVIGDIYSNPDLLK